MLRVALLGTIGDGNVNPEGSQEPLKLPEVESWRIVPLNATLGSETTLAAPTQRPE